MIQHCFFVSASVASAVLCIGVIGCAPGQVVDVPEIHGRVLDAAGPVNNATVEMVSASDGHKLASVMTQPDGTFLQPEKSHLTIYFAGADTVRKDYTVVARQGATDVHGRPWE